MKEKIGTIARYTGLAAHTIKYYENMGLIDNVRDEQSNYRYYELNQRTIIHECMHYRKLDFSIKEIEYMIKKADGNEINAFFDRRLDELNQKIEELESIRVQVEKSKSELEEWDQRENQWYVEEIQPILIYWQTEGTEWIKGREIDKAGIDFDKYDTRTFAQIRKESVEAGPLSYRWGRGLDEIDYYDKTYEESMVERFYSKRAYVTYVKVDEAIGTGKVIDVLKDIFIDQNVFQVFPGDIYLRRIKLVKDQEKAVSYYKVMIPILESPVK